MRRKEGEGRGSEGWRGGGGRSEKENTRGCTFNCIFLSSSSAEDRMAAFLASSLLSLSLAFSLAASSRALSRS